MGFFGKSQSRSNASTASPTTTDLSQDKEKRTLGHAKTTLAQRFTFRIFLMGIIVSMGGFIFGYDTGQISGFLEMPDFRQRFHDKTDSSGNPAFSNSRSGTIVGLLSIGTLLGALCAAPVADRFGRKYTITFWNLIFCVGVIVQITTPGTKWYQVAIGRWVAGLGVGALSVMTPMYQAETAPRYVRGALISCYQLFITLGILVAYCCNYGTEADNSSRSWRLPMGIGFIWPAIMATGILFLRESPRWDYRHGRIAEARKTIAMSYSVPEDHPDVTREIREIQEKLDAEHAGGDKHPWYEIFTGPRMAYRTLLGICLQALQQLTGANFFFYYGTTIFSSVGLPNSYVTSIILGAVNFFTTFPGLYIVERFGRRPALIIGSAWMFMCFMVFASLGHFELNNGTSDPQTIGYVMIVFACLFIAGFAMTWGPLIWCAVGELYPTRYRAKCIALATASNWAWNFLISFFTPYITGAIDYRYGYVFAACCALGGLVVYFFLCESQDRTLEEIDTMYILHVSPMKSKSWQPPEGEELPSLDHTYLTPGARDIRKQRPEPAERKEGVLDAGARVENAQGPQYASPAVHNEGRTVG